MDAARDGLEALDVARAGAAVVAVVVGLAEVVGHGARDRRHDRLEVEGDDVRVDVDPGRVDEEGRVVERRQDRGGEVSARRERVLVGAVGRLRVGRSAEELGSRRTPESERVEKVNLVEEDERTCRSGGSWLRALESSISDALDTT